MLLIGHSHEVSFKVQVVGTSAEPAARLLLGSSPMLCFPAVKDGDQWLANVRIPEGISTGEYDLKVEVILNHRLFTPVTKRVEVSVVRPAVSEPVIDAPVPVSPVAAALATPPVEPAIEQPAETTISFEVPAREEVEAPVVVQPEAPVTPPEKGPSLISSLDTMTIDVPVKEEEKPAPKKVWPKLEPLLPKKPVKESKPIKVSLLDVAKLVAEEEKPAPPKAKPSKKAEPVQVVEVAASVPVVLEKGAVVYE